MTNKKIIHSVVQSTANNFPERIAIQEENRFAEYSYVELLSNEIGHALRDFNLSKRTLVGVAIPASIEYVISIVGVSKSGAIYLPLDIDLPYKRLEYILNNSTPQILITTRSLLGRVKQLLSDIKMARNVEYLLIIDNQQIKSLKRNNITPLQSLKCENDNYTEIKTHSCTDDIDYLPDPDDACYIMYTSGSTGYPKAITGCHKSLSHFIHWEASEFKLSEEIRVSQLAPTTFDVSLRDIFVPLMIGGTICIPDYNTRMNIKNLSKWLAEQEINLIHIVPSLFRLILRELETDTDTQQLPTLRKVFLAGEALYGSDVLDTRRIIGTHVELVNLYGPSETSLAKMFYRIQDDDVERNKIIPLGQPISNTAILILQNNQLCRIGQVGEIYIKTPFRSLGYYNNPDLTAETFIQNPLSNNEDIIYKTGDLGKYLPDRSVEFMGRIDGQVKVNGVRVEVGEIEAVVSGHPDVKQTAVSVHTNSNRENRLICYYSSDKVLRSGQLRQHLTETLPEYILPSFYVRIDKFPLNPNGKINRRALPEPEDLLYENTEYVAPDGEVEKSLADIWGEVLNLKKVGADSSFFEIGGNSLNAIRIISRIYKTFEIEISIRDLFSSPTIRQIAEFIKHRQKKEFHNIEKVGKQPHYELSHAQRRLWVLDHLEGGSTAYNVTNAFLLEGLFDVDVFKKTMRIVVERHESLRTTFTTIDGEPRQIISDRIPEVEVIDLQNQTDPDGMAKEIIQKDTLTSFNLEIDHLVRMIVIRFSPDRTVLYLNMHHIIGDAQSVDVLSNESTALYEAFKRGEEIQLPELRVQYKDFAAWQNMLLTSEGFKQHRDYWIEKLSGDLGVIDLPADYSRPPIPSLRGATSWFWLDKSLRTNLIEFGKKNDATLFMTLLAVLKTLLHRYTDVEDIIVGTAIANRTHQELEKQIGYFVNTLALRDKIQSKDDFLTVLSSVKKTTTEAYDHQIYPFDNLVDELNLKRDVSRSPIFDVGLVYYTQENHQEVFSSFEYSEFQFDPGVSKMDLLFTFSEDEGRLKLRINYTTDLFRAKTIDRLANHFIELVWSSINNPESSVCELNLLTPAEKEKLLVEFPGCDEGQFIDSTLVDVFSEQVSVNPDKIAIVSGNETLTYAEVDKRSECVAHFLVNELSVGIEEPVGLLSNRSPLAFIGILGIMKAGAVYLPLDPNQPLSRLKTILDDCKCKVVLHDILDLNTDSFVTIEHLIDLTAINLRPVEQVPRRFNAKNLAYIIYTSGSTGKPKGVMVEHGSALNAILEMSRQYGIAKDDRVLQFASLSFDASLSEIFMTFLTGATLVIANKKVIENTNDFIGFLSDHEVTALTLPPVYLNSLNHAELETVKTLITAGEPPNPEDVKFYSKYLRYINGYGPTETSICSAVHHINPERDYNNIFPIGKPIANVSIIILDKTLNPVPVGVPGEICIAGNILARGYINEPALTELKFIEHPFKTGKKLYRSGDLGKWNEDGEIIFCGRMDDQVKVRGFRIELGEIEAAMLEYPGITQVRAVCFGEAKNKEITGYFSGRKNIEIWPSVAEFYIYDEVLYAAMASHSSRNRMYLDALKRVISGKKVLEIGPGPEAILSQLCLEAGAEKVYAVELLENTYQKAVKKVKSLGLEDRIILIHDDVRSVELPEKVDYCVSEIVGPIGGSEGSAILINSARKWLYNPENMIPQRSVTKIAAITLSEGEFDYEMPEIAVHHIEKIFEQNGYPFDLRLCLRKFPNTNILSNADMFEDLDYTCNIDLEREHEIRLTFKRNGVFNGFLVWLNLYLDEMRCIDILEERESWQPIYLPFSVDGIEVEKDDYIQATINRRLCSNGFNPDFIVEGMLFKQTGEKIEINIESMHAEPQFRCHEFYQKVFSDGKPVIKKGIDAGDLRRFLLKKLPEYMVPNHLVELAHFPVTASGKIDTAKLPDPRLSEANKASETNEPHSDMEKKLFSIWERIIRRSDFGIHDNFFSLGGDSIKAIQIASALRQENLNLEVRDIFRYPTIAELTDVVKSIELKSPIKQEIIRSAPLTAIQRWFFENHNNALNHFNQSVLLKSDERLNEKFLEEVFNQIFNHHDALRMQFVHSDNDITQKLPAEKPEFKVDIYDLTEELKPEERIKEITTSIQSSMDLENGNIFKVALFRLKEGDRIFIAAHHLSIDGVSWRILLEDMSQGYECLINGKPASLPAKTGSFNLWAKRINEYAQSEDACLYLEYWEKIEHKAKEISGFPTGNDNYTECLVKDLNTVEFELSEEETVNLISNSNKAYNTNINDLLLTALASSFHKSCKTNRLLVNLEAHGREEIIDDIDISRTIGWFTTQYPVIIDYSDDNDIGTNLKNVKENLRKIPNNGISYGILKYLSPLNTKKGIELDVQPQINFNYLGQYESEISSRFSLASEIVGADKSKETEITTPIAFEGSTISDKLCMRIIYDNNRFDADYIKNLADEYKSELIKIINHCINIKNTELTPSDISYDGFSVNELDQFLDNLESEN